MQQYQMDIPVERTSDFILDGEFCPAFYPEYDGYLLLQQKERKLITITDPNDPNRDVMAELFGERLSSALTATPVPECSDVVETPVTSTPKEAESNTAPASETRQKLHKRPGLLLFSIPPKGEMHQKRIEKANTWKRKILNQTEVHKPVEPVTFCIPLSEEQEEEAKKAEMVFGELDEQRTATPPAEGDTVDVPAPLNTTPPKDAEPGEHLAEHLTATPPAEGDTVDVPAPLNTTPPKDTEPGEHLAEHLTATPPAGGDIVDVPAPLNTTPTKEAEPNTAPASETSQSEQNLCKRPGLERKQKKAEKANLRKKKEQKQTETLSQKKTLKPCIRLPGEKDKEVKNSKNTYKEKKRVRFCLPPTSEVEQKDEKKKNGSKKRSGRSD
ncbi:THO complex subunit 2-like isoform X2 [Hemibagrus wyckioides]|uniref:THO complex subunit 2-like isoform X2 n=1 Tax=Hemibagrus wyckioides TaxID=337641 RepID=UPI00266C5B61|nr:THO complex subunit 2-like isoform X2 [Hemibagrus wyckioides]